MSQLQIAPPVNALETSRSGDDIDPEADDLTGAAAITSCCLEIGEANIRNNHIYLTRVMDMFPADVVGGRNEAHAAPRMLRVCWGNETIETDIDGSKRIFRRRGWLGKFFKENRIKAGDRVLLERVGPYLFRISRVM
jgi:hypothetical protein